MELNKTQLIESVFAGSGEMAALMRAFDWSTTPLGPVEQWPQALRICVQIVLCSGYPMSICWGPHYVMLYNDAYVPPMGAKHPSALGHSCREVFPEAWGFMGPMHERIMTRGQETSFLNSQLVPLNRNNYLEECYFAFSYGPIPDDHGHVGGILGTGLETTERVLEDRRRQVLRDLASRTVGARNEQEVWRVSAQTLGEHRLSIPFAFLYEYRPAEHQAYLAGTSVETDETVQPAVIDCHSENLWRLDPALTRDGVVVELGNRAWGLSVPNWPERPKEACVAPIRLGEHSEALGFLVAGIHPGRAFDDAYWQFIHRITEQITIGLASARAFEEQRQRAEALAELDRAKTAFFSNVSHEFRTPLTLMLGPLEEVLPEALEGLKPECHEQLVTVRRNALRLLKLVNTLLDFSRIEAGRVQASYQPTDLGTFTAEIASAFDSAMENAGLRFSVECQPIVEPVYVDRDMWEKIVLNLLSNAFKFTFEGEVALALKPVDGAVQLQVRDTGVGIPEEHRKRVFERFHRIEGIHAKTYEGTGIGLALVQELVKLHGGSVRVESALGQGSTFTVTIATGKEHLPAERIQAAQSSASTKIRAEAYVDEAPPWLGDESGEAVDVATLRKLPSLTSSPGPVPEAKRELIVLADDNADMRRYVMHLLGDRYEVRAVADGCQALEATQELRPALVLADVMMPRLDGFGLLRAIRDDSAVASTPVILLSARAGEESRVEGLQADADDYLVKPFAARELLARVATHVKMAKLRRETAEREERLRGEAEALQTSERNLRLLINTIPTFIGVLRTDGSILYANQTILDYTGLTSEDVQKENFRSRMFHPDDVERLRDERRDALLRSVPFENEQRMRDKNGSYRWFLIRYNPLLDERGRIDRWYATATDIDERKRAEERLHNENLVLREEIDCSSMFEEIIGSSKPMSQFLKKVMKVAPSDSTVLILGETGTGKELIARALHRRSKRANRAFVKVNCAAIPQSLIASELFGHEKGAFTGALQRRVGRFEAANGGTLFLDEIGELPMETQIALLRVLQEKEFERVGSNHPISVDVRLIAATNRDLPAAVAAGTFRQDLFYRLNVFPIDVPPLRDRAEDIPLLVEYFVGRFAKDAGKNIRHIGKQTLEQLQRCRWPGNIRELQNVVERAVILCETDTFVVDESWLESEPEDSSQHEGLSALEDREVEMIEAALGECHGRISGPSGAAAKLGIPRQTLESKIRRLGIDRYGQKRPSV